MILRFFFGIGDPFEGFQETGAGTDKANVKVELPRKGNPELGGLLFAQQAVVHEDAGQVSADRLVDQDRRDR